MGSVAVVEFATSCNVITQITPQPISRRPWQPQESLQSRVPDRFCASTRSLLGNQVVQCPSWPRSRGRRCADEPARFCRWAIAAPRTGFCPNFRAKIAPIFAPAAAPARARMPSLLVGDLGNRPAISQGPDPQQRQQAQRWLWGCPDPCAPPRPGRIRSAPLGPFDWRDASLRLDRDPRKNQIRSVPGLGQSDCSADF